MLKIVWVGFHVEGLEALRRLLESGAEIEAVITLTPELAAKRSGSADYTSLCSKLQVPLYEVSDINDSVSIDLLRSLDPDVIFVIGWTQLLKAKTLTIARIGVIGAHASLLPHNRGRAPVNWALIRGEATTGNSLIWLSEDVDSGEIIDQTVIPITSYDTCETIYQQVARSNAEMILRVVPELQRGLRIGRPQGPTDEQLLPKRTPKDGLIDWTWDSAQVYDFIRAITKPYPGAFSWLDGEQWFIWHCAQIRGVTHARPGQVISAVVSPVEAACGQAIACGKGIIVLLDMEKAGGIRSSGRLLSDQIWDGKMWRNE